MNCLGSVSGTRSVQCSEQVLEIHNSSEYQASVRTKLYLANKGKSHAKSIQHDLIIYVAKQG